MTSKTSSISDTGHSGTLRFPPRSALPPGLTIDPLPILGTTWYERGVRYWARRLGIGSILALSAVVYPIMIWAALRVISGPDTTLFYGLAAGEAVFTIVTGVLVFRRSWRNSIEGKVATRSAPSRAGRTGGGIGSLAFTAGGPLAGLIVFSSLLTAGLFFAAFVTWLVPMPPAEQYARRQLAEQLRIHHKIQQLSPRSKHYGSKHHRKR